MTKKPIDIQLETILQRLKMREGGMDYEKAIREIKDLFKKTYAKK